MNMNDKDTNKSASEILFYGWGADLGIALGLLFIFIGGISFCFAILMIILGINAVFEGRDTLTCNKIEPAKIDCQLTRSSFPGKESEPIPDLQKAEVKITKVRAKTKVQTYNYHYRIWLVTKSGPYTLFYPKSSFNAQDTTLYKSEVSRINNFINDPGKTFIKIEEKDYALSYFIGSILLLIIGWFPWITLNILYTLLSRLIVRAERQEAQR